MTVFDIRSLETSTPYNFGTYSLSFCRPIDFGSQKGYVYNGNKVIAPTAVSPSNVQTVPQTETTDPATHLTFDQVSTTECVADPTKTYVVSYEILCDPTVESATVTVDETDLCNPQVSLTHKSGCPVFQATAIVQWLSTHGWVIGALLIVFGAVANFFGGKYIPYVIAGVAGFITFFAVLLLGSVTGALKALDVNVKPTAGPVALAVFVFVVALALAVFVGWFIKKIERVGITLLGAAAGFLGGFLLYSLVFIQFIQSTPLLIAIVLVGAIVVGFLTWRYQMVLIVYLSAFLGAYAFVRGISTFAGHFPSEVVLYGQISSGAFPGLEWQFYLYLAAIALLGVAGAVF